MKVSLSLSLILTILFVGCYNDPQVKSLEQIKKNIIEFKKEQMGEVISKLEIQECNIDTLTFAQAQRLIFETGSIHKAIDDNPFMEDPQLSDKIKNVAKMGKGDEICFIAADCKLKFYNNLIENDIKTHDVYYLTPTLEIVDFKNIDNFGDVIDQLMQIAVKHKK